MGFIHAVGRLDQATSGLLLLTNDPALSSFLTDPTNRVPRIYLATLRGELTHNEAEQALTGVHDQGELLKCDEVTIQKASRRETHVSLVLTQGKNREIRRLFKALDHEVTRLRRIQYGNFKLDQIKPGEYQEIPIEQAIILARSYTKLSK